jgi:hypothetical protein
MTWQNPDLQNLAVSMLLCTLILALAIVGSRLIK